MKSLVIPKRIESVFSPFVAHVPVIVAYVYGQRAGWGLLRGCLSVFVEPVYRRQGLGAALVEQFV
ncbi:MAG: GNAT family N-acetyltransferase, partial [Pseudomonadota bacterium]